MRVTSISEEYVSGLPSNEFFPELSKRSCFSSLIAEIFDKSRKNSRTGVMLTSPLRQAGVSFVCSCIAAELALQGAKVLLIDARALLAVRTFSPRSVITRCRRIGPLQLWVLGLEDIAGLKATSKDDRTGAIGTLLHELEQEFPYLLIDAPALSSGGDANILATSVYGTVIVARKGQTGESELKKARKALSAFGGRLLGSVFNAH
jgi:succinoglycan biosynthesis transport protein ExoP